jgi:hypothetical protein
MADPADPTLRVSGFINAGIGVTTTITSIQMNYSYGSTDGGGVYIGPGAPIVDGNVAYTVTSPPSHGGILKDGSPTTQFTQQDIDDGRVAYHNDGSSSSSDSFDVFAVVTEVPGIIKPYTPQFDDAWNTNPVHGTNQGAWYAGVTLLGSTQMPNRDNLGGASGSWGVVTPVSSEEFGTTQPNTVVFALVFSTGTATSLPYPSPVSVDHFTFPGLTFTRLGGGSFNTINWDTIHSVQHNCTTNAELFYALAPSVITPTAAYSVTWSVTGIGVGPEECDLALISYGGLADLTNPWGIDPASIQFNNIGNAVPGGLSLNTSVSDQLVCPVLFEVHVGDYDASIGVERFYPKGFSFGSGGFGSGGTVGTFGGVIQQRSGICYATIDITLAGGAFETLTDSELLFQPQRGFVDLSVLATRQLFISLGGTPQWMGPSGALPFGSTPAVYLTTQGPPLDFAGNNGDGGGFAPTGTLEAAAGPGCTPYIVTEASGSAADPQWRLSVSDDGGRTWSTLVKPRSMGKLGKYLTRLRWLKMGQSRERMIRLESTDPVRKNIIGVYLDVGQGMS